MSDWANVAIDSATWWPSRLLASKPSWPGASTARLVRLGEVATVRAVASPLSGALPLVTPRDVDAASGQVEPRQRVDGGDGLVLGEDLRAGDVLVPAHGRGPCVLVSDDVRGIAFRSFLTIRGAGEMVAPSWLWAVLSSTSGAALRESLMVGTMAPKLTASALSELAIPLPALAAAGVEGLVPRPLVAESPGNELRSSWGFRDLRDADAWVGLALEEEPEGMPLAELGALRAGRVDKKDWFGSSAAGRMPVLTHRAVRGHGEAFRPWASGGPATTEATVVFTRTEPFRVTHAPAGMLLSKELLALELGEPRLADLWARSLEAREQPPARRAEALATYFSFPEGREKLAAAARGVVIRHLSLAALGKVRIVPDRILSFQVSPRSAVGSLAQRLDAVLRQVLAP